MSSFGKQLRRIRKERNISQKELAKAIGVGQTSIANYESDTRFPNQERLMEFADYFGVSLDYLLGRSTVKPYGEAVNVAQTEPWEKHRERYLQALLSGNRHMAKECVLSLAKRGAAVGDIYMHILTPVLHQTGDWWESGKIGIEQEHYIAAVTEEMISLLYVFIGESKTAKGTVVLLPVHGETHNLAARMLQDYLQEDGWEPYYLGNHVPTDNLIQALREQKARALVLSVTMRAHLETARHVIGAVRESLGKAAPRILVGGQAVEATEDAWRSIGADGTARTFDETIRRLNEWFTVSHEKVGEHSG